MINIEKYYLFPFEKIKQGSNIVLYGAGVIGRDYLEQIIISDYGKVLFFIDKNYKKINQIKNIPVYGIKKILETEEDTIILIASESYVEEIKEELTKLHVSEKRIITVTNRQISIKPAELITRFSNYDRLNLICEDFLNNGNGNIKYLQPIIDEIVDMNRSNKYDLISNCKKYLLDFNKPFKHKAIILRILFEANLYNKDLFKIGAKIVKNTVGYDQDRFWFIQDMINIIFEHKEYEYDECYVELRETLRKICKNFFNGKIDKYSLKNNEVKRIAVICMVLGKQTNTFLIAISSMIKDLLNFSNRNLEIKIFCEDSMYYENKECFINPVWDVKDQSEYYADIHRSAIDPSVEIYYNKGYSMAERMNNIIESVFEYSPDIIIDCCTGKPCATAILNDFYPIIHRPFDDEKDFGIYHKYLAGIRQEECINENKKFKTMKEKDILDCNFPLPVFIEGKKIFLREEYGIKEDSFVFITAGDRLNVEMKDDFIDYVCEFLNKNSDSVWIVVGRKKSDYFFSRSKEFIDRKQVVIIDYEEELIGLYRICNAYLNPKRKGGGFSMQMAMQVGLPIVTLNMLCDIYRVIGEENLVNGDYKELIEYLQRLKDDNIFYDKMKKRMLDKFWVRTKESKNQINEILSIMDQTLSEFKNN